MSEDIKALVDRLLNLSALLAGVYQDGRLLHDIAPEDAVALASAADALVALAAERDAFRAEVERMHAEAIERAKMAPPAPLVLLNPEPVTAERDALAAEVARLREAMQAAYDDWASHSDSSVGLILMHALATPAPDALAALLRAERNKAREEAAKVVDAKKAQAIREADFAAEEDDDDGVTTAKAKAWDFQSAAAAIRAMKEPEE